MKLALDHLPASARRIAEVIGLEATLALVGEYGCRTIWPWKDGADRAHLAEIIGEAAAEALTRHYREPISVPKCDGALRAAVHADIRAEFDTRTRAGESARAVVASLAGRPPLRYTDRHIWRLLNGVDAGEVVELGQGRLF